jgi:addiction module RelE/StbE family toxin
MNISFSADVIRELKQIKAKHPLLHKKIKKQLKLFAENPRHPSLRTHKLQGNLSDSWSISIERNIRILFYKNNEEVVFFLIGTHEQVYKRK